MSDRFAGDLSLVSSRWTCRIAMPARSVLFGKIRVSSWSEVENAAMADDVNRNELRVVGMSRSGNHAIINWILAQVEGRYCFLNCAEPKTNPFVTARPLGEGEPVFQTNYRGFRLKQEAKGKFTRKDYLVISHEDVFLGPLARGPFDRYHDQWVGSSQTRLDVLILRDPFNLFASRLKFNYSEVTLRTAVRIWKQHAREFLDERRVLRRPRVRIRFNDWNTRRAYRRQLAGELGLTFTDEGLDHVPGTGGGSSFEGQKRQGRASRMKVNQRWRYFADDQQYRELFDDELLELSERIFGPLPGTQQLIEKLPASH